MIRDQVQKDAEEEIERKHAEEKEYKMAKIRA
jgi:hypothetical protein